MSRLLLVAVFVLPFTAHAESLRRETLREYLVCIDVHEQMRAALPMMVAPLTDAILKSQEKQGLASGLSEKQNAAAVAVLKKHVESAISSTVARFDELLSAKELEDVYFPVMQPLYTEEEVKGLIAFYKTPLGKKSIQVNQLVQSKTFTPIQQLVSSRTQAIIGDEMKERREVAIDEMTKAVQSAR